MKFLITYEMSHGYNRSYMIHSISTTKRAALKKLEKFEKSINAMHPQDREQFSDIKIQEFDQKSPLECLFEFLY